MIYAINEASTSKDSGYDKYRAGEDLRTVQESKRIQADPKRMADVRRCAKEMLSEMDDLKSLAAGGKVAT
jgi:hypothetical protein